MQELLTTAELVRVSAGDPMIVWAGQGLRGGVRAWYDGDAVAVASPDLSKRDRLAVSGPVDAVARLSPRSTPKSAPASARSATSS